MTRKCALQLLLVVTVVLMVVARGSAAPESDRAKLQGIWRVKDLPGHEPDPGRDSLATSRMIIAADGVGLFGVKGDRVTLLGLEPHDKPNGECTLRLLPNETPKQFELSAVHSRRPPLRGTYEFTDNALRIGFLGETFQEIKKYFSFSTAREGEPLLELERVDAEYAQMLTVLQGPWKHTEAGEESLLLVRGHVIQINEIVKAKPAPKRKPTPGLSMDRLGGEPRARFDIDGFFRLPWVLRLDPAAQPPSPNIWFYGAPDAYGAFYQLDSGKISFFTASSSRPGGAAEFWPRGQAEFVWTRAYADPESALRGAQGLLLLGNEHLASAKRGLQAVVKDYPGTQAAETAKQDLRRMPPDDEINRIVSETRADKMLKAALELRDRQPYAAKRVLEHLVVTGTSAAAKAKRILEEDRAAQLLHLSKILLPKNPQEGIKRLREIVRDFAGTKAGEEARTLLEEMESKRQ